MKESGGERIFVFKGNTRRILYIFHVICISWLGLCVKSKVVTSQAIFYGPFVRNMTFSQTTQTRRNSNSKTT
jgi:hypothetical protein